MREKKMKQIKRKIIVLMGLVWSLSLLTACGQNKLSDKFDEDKVKEEAMKSIGYFNERDYQSIMDMGSEDFKSAITAEEFAKVSDPYLDKCGDFNEITKTVIAGSKDKKTEKEYAVVVMVGEYKNGKIQFTIAFDEDMKLIEFIFK